MLHKKPYKKWHDQDGGKHEITNMTTSHLFYAVRMVFNHIAPGKLKRGYYNAYYFSDGDLANKVKTIPFLLEELEFRRLSEGQKEDLAYIKAHWSVVATKYLLSL